MLLRCGLQDIYREEAVADPDGARARLIQGIYTVRNLCLDRETHMQHHIAQL